MWNCDICGEENLAGNPCFCEREALKTVAVDPAFMAILAKNIQHFLKHGHEVEP